MIETIKEEESAKLKDIEEQFDSTREETKNKNVEDLESMKHDLIKKIQDLDKEFDMNFKKYVTDTEARANSYNENLKKNEEDSVKINDHQRQITRLKEQTAYFTLKIQQNKKECDDSNCRLKMERDKIVKHYHDLKKSMQKSRDKEEKRLGDLTMNSKQC